MQGAASHEWVKGGPEEGRGEGDEAWDRGCLTALLPGCGLVAFRKRAEPSQGAGGCTAGSQDNRTSRLHPSSPGGGLEKRQKKLVTYTSLHLNHY